MIFITKPWRLNIKDKVKSSNRKKIICPSHHFPHKLPFTKPVINELCHHHDSKLRMFHHMVFCKILRCPHYNFMMKKYKEK